MNVRQLATTYVSRSGQRLEVSLAQPDLAEWLQKIVTFLPLVGATSLGKKVKAGLAIVCESFKYDAKAQAESYRHKRITATQYNSTAGVLFYSTAEQEHHKSAGLGYLLNKNALVCREKAVLTHLLLAELGIPTVVQPGTVEVEGKVREGHAWTVWVEPASARGGTVQAVIDGTWGKVFTNFSYDDKYVKQSLEPQRFFEPIVEQPAADIAKAFEQLNTRT